MFDMFDEKPFVTEIKMPHKNKELFNLSEIELSALRNQVAKAGGKIDILVHPFIYFDSVTYQNNLQKILTRGEDDGPVLILDSEGKFYDVDRQNVDVIQSQYGGTTVYFVPTYTANPEPILHPVVNGFTKDNPDNSGWNAIVWLLKDIGVKTCRVDGLYSNNAPIVPLSEETSNPPCVNRTMNALCADFTVVKSNDLFANN